MVRPRLVEEGVPVGSEAADHELDDHSMADGTDHDEPPRASQHSLTAPASPALNQNTTGVRKSSLQLACGGKLFPQKPKRMHATHVVIGGSTSAQSHEDHALFSSNHRGQRQNEHSMMHPTHFQIPNNQHSANENGLQAPDYPVPVPQHPVAPSHDYSSPYYQGHQSLPHASNPSMHTYNYQQIPAESVQHLMGSQGPYLPSTHHVGATHHHHPHSQPHAYPHASGPPAVRTHLEIGADHRPTERMEGVEDHSVKPPLVVFDGANIAYAYAQALQGINARDNKGSLQPNVSGIQVASRYFQDADMRVLIVLPQSWFRSKLIANNGTVSYQPALEGLQDLQKEQGARIVTAPPTDDDDAYALTIARRETLRINPHYRTQHGHPMQGHGFVLSNDLFRDAAARDETGSLQEWLLHGLSDGTGAGRISFAFCDMGNMDEYGERQLDFVPNPRHPLVAHIEASRLQRSPSLHHG